MLSAPSQFHSTGEFLAVLLPFPHGHGGLLGHAGAQHSRFHALLEIADRAGLGPGIGLPVAMALYTFVGISVHLGIGGALRPSHLESDHAHRRISSAVRGLRGADRHPDRNAERQHRGQRRLALQRLLQSLSRGSSASAPAGLITGFLGLAMCPGSCWPPRMRISSGGWSGTRAYWGRWPASWSAIISSSAKRSWT